MFIGTDRENVRLVIPVSVNPDESLGDLLLRATALNAYVDSSLVTSLAGFRFRHLGALGVTALGREDQLANLLGLPGGAADLKPIMHSSIDGKRGWVNFHGTPMRWTHVKNVRRRVSPRSLRSSPYWKAIWNVKVFSFDPKTKEALLDQCPGCGRAFDYLRTRGVFHCGYCTVVDSEGFVRGGLDLRDYPQPRVDVEDVEALDFVTGLVDPDPEVRCKFRLSIADGFATMGRGEIFEFVVALACALTSDPAWTSKSLKRPEKNEEYRRFSPSVLSRAGRILLGWPHALHEAAEDVRAEAHLRPGHFGIQKELGPLLSITQDTHTHPEMRRLLYVALRDNMASSATSSLTVRRVEHRLNSDLITKTDAALRFKCSKRFLGKLASHPAILTIAAEGVERGPTLFNVRQLEEMFRFRDLVVASNELARSMGVPRTALPSIASAGFLQRGNSAICDILLGKEYYVRSSGEDLLRRLRDTARAGEPPFSYIKISIAVNRLAPVGTNPWPIILAAMLERKFKVWKIEGRSSSAMSSLAVENISVIGDLLFSGAAKVNPDDSTILTQYDVSLLLCTTPHNVAALVQLGLLPRAIKAIDVDSFRQRYMLMSDVAATFRERGVPCTHRALGFALAEAGIQPIAILKYGKKTLWAREKINAISLDLPTNFCRLHSPTSSSVINVADE